MKPFIVKDFIKSNYTIPNSDSDLVITEGNNDRYPSCIITYKGHKLAEFGKGHRYYHVRYTDIEQAIDLGLINKQVGDLDFVQAIIDSLYYTYNPLKLHSSRGEKGLLASFWRNLYIRSEYSLVLCSSFVYNKMIEAAVDALTKRYNKPEHPIGSEEFNRLFDRDLSNSTGSNIRKCLLTGEVLNRRQCLVLRLNGETVAVKRDLELSDYGYRVWDGGYLLKHGQILWRERVYNTEDGLENCPECESSVPTMAIDPDEGICVHCIEQRYKIHSYSTRVPDLLKFKAKNVKPKDKPIYLGCELEYETTNKDIARIKVGKLLQGHAIMKSDGSIRNGFEIVTCPATLDIHLEEFSKFFKDLPEELEVASNVGMHVHVSRSPLSMFTIGKLTAFMNKESNKKFIEYIAGRQSNNYCNIDPRRTVTFPWTTGRDSGRYNALNLQPDQTIEFRIFSTPKTYEEFASKLQFCRALVEYAMPANIALPLKEQISADSFIKWVIAQNKSYPQLVKVIKEFA